MAHTFARAGYKIELLNEIPGTPSPDALIDGIPADLKSQTSHKTIVKNAKKAIREQGAKIVLFEFETETTEVYKELLKLKRFGINTMYYFKGRAEVYKI